MKQFEKNYFRFFIACIGVSLAMAGFSYVFFDTTEVFYFALSPIIVFVFESAGRLINATFRAIGFCLALCLVQIVYQSQNSEVLEIGAAGHFIVAVTRAIFHVVYEKPNSITLWAFRLLIISAPFTFFGFADYHQNPTAIALIVGITLFMFYGIEYMVTTLRRRLQNIRKEQKAVNENMKLVKNLNSLISHNLRTPVANLLGQVQIASLRDPENLGLQKIQSSAEIVLEQLNVLISAKKASKNASTLTEYIDEWASKYNQVNLAEKECHMPLPSEEVLSVLYTALSVFTDNSLQHNSRTIDIYLRNNTLIHQDYGSGMSPERLAQFGEPLASNRVEGNGLGVHYATQLLEQVGIGWKVESEVGKGTRITLNCSPVEKIVSERVPKLSLVHDSIG